MDIRLKNQPFDLEFAPGHDIVYTGLLTGEIKAFSFSQSSDDESEHAEKWTIRPTKRSCRGLATDTDGSRLFSVSKDKALHTIDPSLGKVVDSRLNAHDSPINRVALCMPQMVATGDDEGVIKLWDPRKPGEIRSYTHHFDYISDFLWLEDKKTLVATSGDGSLSAIDVRSSKTKPMVQSEDQEDELLSVTAIKNNSKLVVGTQLGMLSVFNRAAGYGDCVDRIPGHPHSVDALATLTDDVIATGSSDGFIRLVHILPSKLLGVIGDHGEFPVERIKIDVKKKWLGSVSHDEVLKLIDVEDALESEGEEEEEVDEEENVTGGVEGDSDEEEETEAKPLSKGEKANDSEDVDSKVDSEDGDSSEPTPPPASSSRPPIGTKPPPEKQAPPILPATLATQTEAHEEPGSDSSDEPQPKRRRKIKDPTIMSKDMAKKARQREKEARPGKKSKDSMVKGTKGFFEGLG